MANRVARLGIDVGGTNTDAVVMVGDVVLASAKRLTTPDVSQGVINVVGAVLSQAGLDAAELGQVMIGTTQFINAFVQRKHLEPVAAVRITLPKADGIPPFVGWPSDLVDVVGEQSYLVGGGSFYDGREYAPLDVAGLEAAARDLRARKIRSVAVIANFAPVRPDIERRAAEVLLKHLPDADITLSSEVGGLGLIDRENAALINASLRQLSRTVVSSLTEAFQTLGVKAPIYLSQNDGTLISTDYATRFPILTCSAGPTNSIRGAAFLTGLQDAIVIDVGGTTSDFGFLVRGFPRETVTAHLIGGVRTNFRMPDVLSIALGGGTLVRFDGDTLRLGPESVGYQLGERALIFGGRELTTTDIAVRAGTANIGEPKLVRSIEERTVATVLDAIHRGIEDTIDRLKTNSKPVPVILVGGGHILISRPLRGVSTVHRPQHAEVANAVGAAISLVSGRVDKIFDFTALGRDAALAGAKQEAREAAVAAGAAADTVEIVDIVELPLTHMRTGAVHLKVRAVGQLAATKAA
ncbi:MAG: hydantoinase [Gammaproteobacteria bacterium]|nr:hydantoinase [Gammaproteobacteria bacterium]